MAQQFPSPLLGGFNLITPRASTYDAFIAAGQDAATTNPLASILEWRNLEADRDTESLLEIDEQERIIDEADLGGFIEPREGETEESLLRIIDLKREELARQTIIANAEQGVMTTAATLGAGLFVSLLDPLNVATAFVPAVAPARYAAMLSQRASRLGRFAVRSRVGALEGAVGAALVEPAVLATALDRQADYDLYDSFANLAFGAALGGGLHGVGGYFKDVLKPSITAQHVIQAIDHASPEARSAAFRASIGQVAAGRQVQGVDYLLRTDLENSTAVGRFLSDEGLDIQEAVATATRALAEPPTAPVVPITVAKRFGPRSAVRSDVEQFNKTGFEVVTRKADDGSFEVDLVLPTEMFVRNPDGSYLTFRDRKRASKARTRLKKEGIIERGTAVKIGDEWFVDVTTDKTIIDAINKNTVNLPLELPRVDISQQSDGTFQRIPDVSYGADAVRRAHAPENVVFHDQETVILNRIRENVEPETVDPQRQIDEDMAEINRLKDEIGDDPLFAEAERLSEADVNNADAVIAETRKTADGIRQAAACVLGGIV